MSDLIKKKMLTTFIICSYKSQWNARSVFWFDAGVHKITALTMCLCKLHSFCINERDVEIPDLLCQDKAYGMSKGGRSKYQFEPRNDFPEELVPNSILHTGVIYIYIYIYITICDKVYNVKNREQQISRAIDCLT